MTAIRHLEGRADAEQGSEGERGNLTLFLAVVSTALLAVIGLTYDGASKVQATQQADLAAAEAARAGGQELNVGAAVTGGGGVTPVNPAAAVAAANRYLTAAGFTGSASATGDIVTVTTQVQWTPVMLSIVGVGPQVVEGHATTRSANGVSKEQR